MARKRMIDPEFWSDEKIGNLSREARLLFIGMWNFSDDVGIFKSRAEYLRSNILPYDDITIEAIQELIEQIRKQNLIFCYTVAGQSYAIILNFRKHQTINKPTPSKLPAPSIQNREYQRSIFERDNWTCHICGDYLKDRFSSKDGLDNMASIDHVLPKSNGGNDLPHNLLTACLKCNKGRGNKPLPEYYGSSKVGLLTEDKRSEDKLNENKKSEAKLKENKEIIPSASPSGSEPKGYELLKKKVQELKAEDVEDEVFNNPEDQATKHKSELLSVIIGFIVVLFLPLLHPIDAKTRYVITLKETSPMKADNRSGDQKVIRSRAGSSSGSLEKEKLSALRGESGFKPATRATLEQKIMDLFGKDGPVALAIAKAESGLRCNALGDTNLSPSSYGIFQIRAFPTRPPVEDLYDCHKNIDYAFEMYKRQGFSPWSAYTSGSYLKFL